mmetsp:Transcript_15582/g.39595  ORF Transcript_15582/g.39595 Transcript_15582/m.39595 type:complete len:218 (+) Transcript_15582:791-1444(+)
MKARCRREDLPAEGAGSCAICAFVSGSHSDTRDPHAIASRLPSWLKAAAEMAPPRLDAVSAVSPALRHLHAHSEDEADTGLLGVLGALCRAHTLNCPDALPVTAMCFAGWYARHVRSLSCGTSACVFSTYRRRLPARPCDSLVRSQNLSDHSTERPDPREGRTSAVTNQSPLALNARRATRGSSGSPPAPSIPASSFRVVSDTELRGATCSRSTCRS